MKLIDLSKLTIKINFAALWKFIKHRILKKRLPEPKNFGLQRDKPDSRDLLYKVRKPGMAPESTYMRNIHDFPWRYNQGPLGSCTGQGIASTYRRVLQVKGQPDFEPSRLFAYYNSRAEDSKAMDSGASIRDTIKAVAKYGLCKETTWPYDIGKFSLVPSPEAYLEALDHQALHYERLPQTKEAIMDAVWQGFPVIYGKMLYESFMSEEVARTGNVPYPKTCWENEEGGHCMVIFDYNSYGTIELNSWGDDWGIGGICSVPWKYVLNPKLAFDFWVVWAAE